MILTIQLRLCPPFIIAAVLWSLISAIRRETFAPFHSNQTVAIKAVPHGLQRRRVEPPRRAPAAAREAGVDGKNPFQGKKLTLGVTRDLPLFTVQLRENQLRKNSRPLLT